MSPMRMFLIIKSGFFFNLVFYFSVMLENVYIYLAFVLVFPGRRRCFSLMSQI